MNDSPEKPSSVTPKTPTLKEGLFQGFRNKIAEKRTRVDKAKFTLRESEKKKEQAQLSADLDKSNPGVFPNPPETLTSTETKPETTSDESEKLREEVGKEIGEEIKTKIESVKESKSLEVLGDEEKKEIHTEILHQSIALSDLSEKQKIDAQASVTDSLDGDTPEKKAQAWKNLSKEKQEEMMLETEGVKKSTEILLTAYQDALRKPENLQDGKVKPEVLSQLAKAHLGSDTMSASMTDALTLDVLQNSADKKLREESSMEIASRVISEKGLKELTDTVGVENLKWSHIPPMVKLQMIGSGKFNYDKATLFEKNPQFAESLGQAIQGIQQKPGESPEDYKKRMQQEYGLDDKAVVEGVQQLASSEGGSVDTSGNAVNTSNISPFMQFLWDIFATIGAMLPGETGAMCRNYLSKSAGAAASYAESGSGGTGRHNGTSGEGIPESTGAPGEVSRELAEMGFRGNIMDSIWQWEYQPGHKAEVVPAGKSGFTLCGGIDLAYTPFSDVQTIFAGVLKPETIQAIKPFCDNGGQGPIRGTAQNLLNSKPGLLQEINSQLTEENMPTAFSRSLARDWERLIKKYPSAKNAPGYIQTIMLSRFYHDGSGGSSDIISAMVKSNFDHATTVSLLQSRRGRRSASYYRNRIDKEVAYVGKRPPDSKPVNNPTTPQDSSGETGTNQNNTQTSGEISVGDSITTAMRGGEDDSVAKSTDGYGKYYKIGANSSTILGYVENAIAANPPSISILAGTNDITSGGNPLGNIQAMVQKCRAANIPVYLGTLPPIRGKESAVNQVNAGIRGLAGEGVHIIDYASLGIQTTDGVHPNTEGYNKMKNLASSQIQSTTTNTPKTMVA